MPQWVLKVVAACLANASNPRGSIVCALLALGLASLTLVLGWKL